MSRTTPLKRVRPDARTTMPRAALVLALALVGCVADASEPAPPPLAVTIAGPAAADAGDVLSFEAAAEGVASDTGFWLWDFGDGAREEGVGLVAVQHEFAEPGAFRVAVDVIDVDGRRGSAMLELGLDAAYDFEGTVTATAPAPVGGAPARADFDARTGLAAVELRVALTRPTALPADPTPAAVAVRVLVRDAEVGRVDVAVPAGGETVRLRVPGDRVADAFRVEVLPEQGTVHFEAEVRLDYAGGK